MAATDHRLLKPDLVPHSSSWNSAHTLDIRQSASPRCALSGYHYVQRRVSNIFCEQSLPVTYPDALYPSHWTAANVEAERAGYISIEKMDNFADITQEVVNLAGLGKVVKVCPPLAIVALR